MFELYKWLNMLICTIPPFSRAFHFAFVFYSSFPLMPSSLFDVKKTTNYFIEANFIIPIKLYSIEWFKRETEKTCDSKSILEILTCLMWSQNGKKNCIIVDTNQTNITEYGMEMAKKFIEYRQTTQLTRTIPWLLSTFPLALWMFYVRKWFSWLTTMTICEWHFHLNSISHSNAGLNFILVGAECGW